MMMRRAWPALAALIVLGLAGCGESRLTLDNYERLEAGMTRDQVEEVLGAPSECSGAVMVDNCLWGDAQRFIQAQFVGGKAMTYQYQGLK